MWWTGKGSHAAYLKKKLPPLGKEREKLTEQLTTAEGIRNNILRLWRPSGDDDFCFLQWF
jgi:hypothetical protein